MPGFLVTSSRPGSGKLITSLKPRLADGLSSIQSRRLTNASGRRLWRSIATKDRIQVSRTVNNTNDASACSHWYREYHMALMWEAPHLIAQLRSQPTYVRVISEHLERLVEVTYISFGLGLTEIFDRIQEYALQILVRFDR